MAGQVERQRDADAGRGLVVAAGGVVGAKALQVQHEVPREGRHLQPQRGLESGVGLAGGRVLRPSFVDARRTTLREPGGRIDGQATKARVGEGEGGAAAEPMLSVCELTPVCMCAHAGSRSRMQLHAAGRPARGHGDDHPRRLERTRIGRKVAAAVRRSRVLHGVRSEEMVKTMVRHSSEGEPSASATNAAQCHFACSS